VVERVREDRQRVLQLRLEFHIAVRQRLQRVLLVLRRLRIEIYLELMKYVKYKTVLHS